MTTAQRTAIAAPATGLLVYDIWTKSFWFFDGAAWTNMSVGGGGTPATFIADTDGNTKVQTEESPDGRYKKQVQENVKGLDFIRRLRPVTYNLDVRGLSIHLGESTPEGGSVSRGVPKDQIRYTGFIAQEVEAAARQAGYDFSGVDVPQNAGGLYGLRYAEFTVPLVKAVQEQQVVIEAQTVEIQKQGAENAALKAQLETLKTQLDAQSAQLKQITAALQTAGIGVGN